MWVAVIIGFVVYLIVKLFFYEDDTLLDLDSSHSTALFTVAKRLEKLYHGSKVYVGIQIPDADSASRRNIDLVLVTNHEAVVISVKSLSGFVSTDKDGNWLCTDGKHHRTNLIPNPVPETKQLVSILEEYLEQRGVTLPEGYLSFKVICPNPKFCCIQSDTFPPEVITYDQWKQLKPETKSSYSGWIKGVFHGGKDKMHDSIFEKLNSVLNTAPISDRLELKGNRYVLGEFLEFKGKQEDIQTLKKIRRSKVSHVSIQKISMFGFAHSTVQVLYAPRDYRVEGSSRSPQYEEVTVRSSTEVVFQPQNSTKPRKYKLSSVISLSLSA
ncbi:hypothetical protein PHJA_003014100 [Phtheirospermum japonicum]|uniref:NERD domain-containing protein n=1 Tax=Phtheirospermum japonicum TaxID=374723 RepID=A0A830D9P9_9LAMI|nr:hypothetical protein PHJA_003014100 [Phtheirospermum japonicum]